MKHGTQVGLGPGHTVLAGDPAFPQKGDSPQFSAHVYCGQTSGRIKMPLGTQVGLGPGDIVLDADPAPPKRSTAAQFSAHVYCGNGRPSQLKLRSCKICHTHIYWRTATRQS